MKEFLSSEISGRSINTIQLNPQSTLGRVGVNSIFQRTNYEMSGVYPTIRRGKYLASSAHPNIENLLRNYRKRNPFLVSKPSSSNTFIHVRSQSGDNVKISRNDFEELTKFVKKNILDRLGVLDYLSFSKTRSIF